MSEEQESIPLKEISIIDRRVHLIQAIAQANGIGPEMASINPIMDDKSNEPVGIMYTYKCSPSEDSLRGAGLMFAFSHFGYCDILIPTKTLMQYEPVEVEQIQQSINLLVSHPDKLVMHQVAGLVDTLLSEGSEVRIIPWRDLAAIITPDINPDEVNGSTYPLMHFLNADLNEEVIINISPIFNVTTH
ncbi:MAG: hypothetical protein IBX57_00415 [Gammaproteobacteria bacterium]|nr:hypothetical protein [Gammaproteobacteria bacterium]